MKVYYAHPMSWYSTEREAADIEAIHAQTPMGTEVINPAEVDAIQGKDSREIMSYLLGLVQDADAIAYRTFDDDFIGAGVAQEVLTAALYGKQIFRIMDLSTKGKIGPVLFEQNGLRAQFGPRILTIVATRDRIKRGVM